VPAVEVMQVEVLEVPAEESSSSSNRIPDRTPEEPAVEVLEVPAVEVLEVPAVEVLEVQAVEVLEVPAVEVWNVLID